MTTTHSHTDRFWGIFIILAISFVTLPTLVIAGYLYTKNESAILSKISSFGPTSDPFEEGSLASSLVSLSSDFLYREFLPLNFSDWSWDVENNWQDATRPAEGSYALKTHYKSPWSGVYLHSPNINLKQYAALSLDVFVENGIKDLFLSMYDETGNSTVKQSLAWYFPEHTLKRGQWQHLTIPLANLFASTTLPTHMSGIAISAAEPGDAFIDTIRLERSAIAHEPWKEPVEIQYAIPETQKLSPLIPLPYRLNAPLEENLKVWTILFGQVEATNEGIKTGPLPGQTTGSMAVLAGSREWRNYETSVTMDWGLVPVFSLLTRFTDDRNFISCAFQNYGSSVQIYSVVNGNSSLVAQTPLLATQSYESWQGVHVGTKVIDDTVYCLIRDEVVLTAKIPTIARWGMIGFETWDQNGYPAPHIIKSLTARSL